ncbi:hypothetical protein evm_014980 [Chilo suppressalis]|nr:hypothetical protein evm_014980 [Chilo suppressalis]
MIQETFYYILDLVKNRLMKNWGKQPILPEERLVVTIRSDVLSVLWELGPRKVFSRQYWIFVRYPIMEPERRKVFKKKIQYFLGPETPEKRKKTVKENEVQDLSKKVVNPMPETVTVLGSQSYMEQNKDLLILQPLDLKNVSQNVENDLKTKDEERWQNEPNDYQTINNKTPKKAPGSNKENDNTKNNEDELIDEYTTANPKIDIIYRNIDQSLLEPEEVHYQEDITANSSGNLEMNSTENKDKPENVAGTNLVSCEQITKTILQRDSSQETEIEKKESSENSEHLTPTILEIIPDKDMDIIRKSLEEENAQDEDLPSFPENEEPLPKQKKRNSAVMKKSYVDFLSDPEGFEWDSSSWKETGDESSGEIDLSLKKRKKKGKKRLKETRVDGSITKEKQLQENPCVGKKCGNNCAEIAEDRRKQIFDHFWSLSAERKKDWLVGMASKMEIKRKRSKDLSSRENTFKYFINDGEGRRPVCQQFLLKTLDITQRYVNYTLTNAIMGSAKPESRGRIVPKNKTSDTVKASAVDFIKQLPALPSHYCRKDTTKLYLPVEFKNLKNLYRFYKETHASKGVDYLSERLFRDIFNLDFNIGFHVPKKDKCLKCLRFEGKNVAESEEMKEHLEEKDASKKRLECHREIVKRHSSIICTSFDLQKVLNTPYGSSMLLFYSRKYSVFNLCFYESVTRRGFCYLWGETEAKRGGNEISTILKKYINNVDQLETTAFN